MNAIIEARDRIIPAHACTVPEAIVCYISIALIDRERVGGATVHGAFWLQDRQRRRETCACTLRIGLILKPLPKLQRSLVLIAFKLDPNTATLL